MNPDVKLHLLAKRVIDTAQQSKLSTECTFCYHICIGCEEI